MPFELSSDLIQSYNAPGAGSSRIGEYFPAECVNDFGFDKIPNPIPTARPYLIFSEKVAKPLLRSKSNMIYFLRLIAQKNAYQAVKLCHIIARSDEIEALWYPMMRTVSFHGGESGVNHDCWKK